VWVSGYAQKDFMATAQRDACTAFATGQTAMILDGIWAVETYCLKTNPNIKLGSFLAPPAKAGDPVRQYAYVDGGYAVNSKSKVKDAALEVVAYTATAEFAQMYADMHAKIPGNKNVKFRCRRPGHQRLPVLPGARPAPVGGTPLLPCADHPRNGWRRQAPIGHLQGGRGLRVAPHPHRRHPDPRYCGGEAGGLDDHLHCQMGAPGATPLPAELLALTPWERPAAGMDAPPSR
jgi:hypothetical protein